MPAHTRGYSPGKLPMGRPPLPVQHINTNLRELALKPPAVKFQEITREGQATIVGRIKIPTPNGHAFILRRLDTGAISLTTMFRAAFPTATEDAERQEAAWVKAAYDTAGANKSGKARFAGTWVNPETAVALAGEYALSNIISLLAESSPDPNTTYRKSTRTQQQQPTPQASPVAQPPPAPTPPTSSPTVEPPAKRRREVSPIKSTPPPSLPATTTTPATLIPAPSYQRGTTPTRRSRTPVSSPSPRRSARLKSPVPSSPAVSTLSPKTPKLRVIREDVMTPGGSDETAVDDEAHEAAKVTEVNMTEDLREQKALIEKLKADRDAKLQSQQHSDHDMDAEEEEEVAVQKRARDEGPEYTLNIKEPEEEKRVIVSNSRIRILRDMPPERKSLAWGALFFAAGLSAISFLPSALPSITNFF